MTVGHGQCRTTLFFPVSEVFDKGGKMPLKVKKRDFLSEVNRLALLFVDFLIFRLAEQPNRKKNDST